MKFNGKTVVVTGGGSGIGAAMVRQMAAKGAHMVVVDRNIEAAANVAKSVGGLSYSCDVRDEAQIRLVIEKTESNVGTIDCFVSNAGIAAGQPGHAASAGNDVWALNWDIHVMAHVYAARALLDAMVARGSGYFVNVASAAGLLNQIHDAAYSATKHAAVSFAESLRITHGDQGIGVSVVCPQYVATPLIGLGDQDAALHETLLTAEEVAQAVVAGVETDTFRILPHPQVAEYAQLRASEPERWLKGMQKLQSAAHARFGAPGPGDFYKLV